MNCTKRILTILISLLLLAVNAASVNAENEMGVADDSPWGIQLCENGDRQGVSVVYWRTTLHSERFDIEYPCSLIE